MNNTVNKPQLQKINYPDWNEKNPAVSILREDLVHPFIGGNKWRKLKYNIIDFKNSGKTTIVTFGGAFSNHLVATAAASKEYGFDAIAIVRGDVVKNDYIDFIHKSGMKTHFISRSDYRNKNSDEFIKKISEELLENNLINNIDDIFILPEGGSNPAAVKGASEIMDEILPDTEFIVCACGTGATIAGISKNLLPHQKAIGIPVLKAEGYIEREIVRLGGNLNNVIINSNYHFGGYAKKNKSLLDFCHDFTAKTNIPAEPIYTGKLFFAIDDLIKTNYFKTRTKVTLIHTGGILKFNWLM